MNLALELILFQCSVFTSHPGVLRAEQFSVEKEAYFSFKMPEFQEQNSAFTHSTQPFCNFCLPFLLQTQTFTLSYAFFLSIRTDFWCHLVTSQDIFLEFLSIFAFASQIFEPVDSKATTNVNAAMVLKPWNTALEPMDTFCEQSPSFIQVKLLFALFAEGSSVSCLTARIFTLLTSGNIWIKNFQAKLKLPSSSSSR